MKHQPFKAVLFGALIGLCISCAVAWQYYAEWRWGNDLPGAGFGLSHLVFFISLPWSVAVWAAMVGVGLVLGLDGPAFMAPWFLIMPIVAGACWGWCSREILEIVRRQ